MALEDVARAAGVDIQTIRLIAKWEGCLRHVGGGMYVPYLCPARVPTIGYGTTEYNQRGVRVQMTDPAIPKSMCEELLAYDIGKKYAPAVDRLKLPWQHGNQRGACISMAYNVGTAGFAKSTLCWMIRHKQYDRVPREFMKWVRGGGRVLPGLVNRRREEAAMFATRGGTLPATGAVAPPAVTPQAPPEPAPSLAPIDAQPAPTPPSRSWWRNLLWWK